MINNLREITSAKILDFVETIPRFRKGVISRLQELREWQKEQASESHVERVTPQNASINLNKITLNVTFEHENFNHIKKGLKRLFHKNDKINKFIKGLEESEDSIFAASWHNLGYITKPKKGIFPDVEVVDSLPVEVDFVSLSFYRILPSLACIIFEFKITEEISNKINRIQKRKHLPPVLLTKFWPLSKLGIGYSMSMESGCLEIISAEKNIIRKNLEKWISKSFKWNKDIIASSSYIDVYEIQGNPTDSNLLKKWLQNKRRWLYDYGISINDFDAYFSNELLYTTAENISNSKKSLGILTKIDDGGKRQFGGIFEYKVRAISISSVLYNIIQKYRNDLESIRSKGFKNLYKNNERVIKSPSNILKLKKLITLIYRLDQEVEQSQRWISSSISEIGTVKNLNREIEVDLVDNTVKKIKYQILLIKKAAEVIDSGLTNYISVQSITTMYKLQKRMLLLSIVVTLATLIGLTLQWNEFKSIVFKWIDYIMVCS